ncbi:MAG: hypothetical protein II661_01495 [Bacteroidales bacterium]|nr:hypothetical protein [Bacteroidales bacterium]
MYGCNINVTTNVNGIPYLTTTGVSVTDASVDLSLGFRRIPRIGKFVIRVANAIPDGTTGTLPVQVTLNGVTRPLTLFGGTSVTAADFVGTGIIEVWYDWFEGITQVTSPITAA